MMPLISDECRQRSEAAVCITLGSWTVDSTRWRQILAENGDLTDLHSMRSLWGPHWINAMRFRTEKLEWCGYLMVKIFLKICLLFIRFDGIHERDGPTDRRTNTAWWHGPRLWIAARRGNYSVGAYCSAVASLCQRCWELSSSVGKIARQWCCRCRIQNYYWHQHCSCQCGLLCQLAVVDWQMTTVHCEQATTTNSSSGLK